MMSRAPSNSVAEDRWLAGAGEQRRGDAARRRRASRGMRIGSRRYGVLNHRLASSP